MEGVLFDDFFVRVGFFSFFIRAIWVELKMMCSWCCVKIIDGVGKGIAFVFVVFDGGSRSCGERFLWRVF